MGTLWTGFGIQCFLIIFGPLVLIEIVAYLYFCFVFDEREGRTYLTAAVLLEFSSPNDIEVIQLSYNPQFKSYPAYTHTNHPKTHPPTPNRTPLFGSTFPFTDDQQFYKVRVMAKISNPKHYQSHTGFVLINGQTKQEEPVQWEWLTQRGIMPLKSHKPQPNYPRFSYSEKKNILNDLQLKERSSSSFKIRQGFSRKQRERIISTATSRTTRSQKKLQPFVYVNTTEQQTQVPSINFGINEQQLFKRMYDAKMSNRSMLGLITVRRMGLRYKFNHSFIEYCSCDRQNHQLHELKELSSQVKLQMKEFSKFDKELYYFHLNGTPIHHYQELITKKLYVLMVDTSPRLHFNYEVHSRVIDLAQKIQTAVLKCKTSIRNQLGEADAEESDEDEEQHQYDWQKIKNIKEYVDQLSENPHHLKMKSREEKKSQLAEWYSQRFAVEADKDKSPRQNDKNLLFESQTHFPNEMINRKLLSMANQRVQNLPNTKNRHKYIPQRIDLMLEHVRRQALVNQQLNTGKPKPKQPIVSQNPFTKKDMLLHLDRKNSLLSTQNIPYLIEKYGLNRFEIYNLYNLYKSFEKVALMRDPSTQTMKSVIQRGIDRETFEVGLKGLDMNPGDELIKNICHFGDFVSWQQFIKIISISLRKTPQEKLTAILKGISSFDDGYLTRHQISLMIGNSLEKLFDREEVELQDYFTNMAMRQFDQKGEGKVSVQTLKEKVLMKGTNNLNMVSFLILNT